MSANDSPPGLCLESSILETLMRAGTGTLGAPEIAQIIAPRDWQRLLIPIRRAAIALAQAGRLVIYRKGRPADPHELRGVFRMGLPRHD